MVNGTHEPAAIVANAKETAACRISSAGKAGRSYTNGNYL